MAPTRLGLSALGLAVAGAVLADEKLPADQRANVGELLRKEGFAKWEEVELEDGMIEVDASGRECELKLDPQTLAIVKREEDHGA